MELFCPAGDVAMVGGGLVEVVSFGVCRVSVAPARGLGCGFAGVVSFVVFPLSDLAIVEGGLTKEVPFAVSCVISFVGLSSGMSDVSDRAGPSRSVFFVPDCAG